MKAISAHVTGFYHSSFHAYTTEVNVDGHRWRLGLRYSKFHEFYDQLLLADAAFHAAFPPKGSLFFSPKPEERQEQLEAFLQHVLAHFAARGQPAEIEALLCDLLKVPRHLRAPEHEDDDASTSTESVLDEPMHEPPSSTDSFRLDKEQEQQEEEDKAQVQAPAAPAAPAEQDPDQNEEPEAAAAVTEKEEAAVAAPEPVHPASPVAEEARPVEEVEPATAHEDAETPKETPASVEEAEVVKEEEPAAVEEEAAAEEAEPSVPEKVARAEEAESIAEEAAAEAVAEPLLEGPEVVLSKQQPAIEPIAQGEEPIAQNEEPVAPEPQTANKNLTDDTVAAAPNPETELKEELTVSGSVSSWLAAYLPKSLLAFVRRRCMKKTNLVVLCVALLLPMVLARR
ncbi:Filamentous hemagglutinin [Phytophthora cinnamomi]|uniref:Filamentous hemagglutinin n=1 Tax=Phytophthora cinnamomi TaxID=4785 RepID=UPI003559EDEE|nr:Filamentous hemagglutinin [Phytophthora cinnamomi]